MKWKRTAILVGLGIATVSLAGCVFLNSPKNAYIHAVKEVENATSYSKTTQLDIQFLDKQPEALTTMETILMNSEMVLTSRVNRLIGKSDMSLELDGSAANYPIDAAIHMVLDEKKEFLYVEASSLTDALKKDTSSQDPTNTWVSIDLNGKQDAFVGLMETKTSSLLAAVPEEKFVRSEVSSVEKTKKIVDVVSVNLTKADIQQLTSPVSPVSTTKTATEYFFQTFQVESIELTAYFDRKGKLVQENMVAILNQQVQEKSHTLAVKLESKYASWEEPVVILFDESKEKIVPLAEWNPATPTSTTP